MMLEEASSIEVVAEAADGYEALQTLDRLGADLVLMDIRMPQLDGLSATERICSAPAPPEVIVLTTFDADAHVHRALSAGAAGFLLKDTPPDQIVESIRRVFAGEPVLSPSVLRDLIDRTFTGAATARADRAAKARERLSLLGEREREVVEGVGEGLSNAEVAARVFLAVPTVKTHVSSAMAKLGVASRVQLALLVHEADPGSGEP